jgi:hypothetical protein
MRSRSGSTHVRARVEWRVSRPGQPSGAWQRRHFSAISYVASQSAEKFRSTSIHDSGRMNLTFFSPSGRTWQGSRPGDFHFSKAHRKRNRNMAVRVSESTRRRGNQMNRFQSSSEWVNQVKDGERTVT